MKATKNLFDFATKELSQDAFLRWLIESIVDPDVAQVSRAFLKWITGCQGEIEVVKTEAQWKHIDIVAELYNPKTNQSILLAIEDKINSGEHDGQLTRYVEKLKGWGAVKLKGKMEGSPIKVFYKTAHMDKKEQERIENVGWRVFELNGIAKFFKSYEDYKKSEIVRSYARHILGRKRVSTQPIEKWSNANFEAWYWECFRDQLIKDFPQLHFEGKIWNGHYFSCFASKSYKENSRESVCLEIIFRPGCAVGGIIWPRKGRYDTQLPNDASTVSKNFRDALLPRVNEQAVNKWSSFRRAKKNATKRVGAIRNGVFRQNDELGVVCSKVIDVLEEFNALFDDKHTELLQKCRRATAVNDTNRKV